VTISGPDGYVYDKDGVSGEKIEFMLEMRASGRDRVQDYADKFKGVEFHAGRRPWDVSVDVALPCAIQNELNEEDAKKLLGNGCKVVVEGSNMSSTLEAVRLFTETKTLYAPARFQRRRRGHHGLRCPRTACVFPGRAKKWMQSCTRLWSTSTNACVKAANEIRPSGQLRRGRQHRRLQEGCRRDGCPGPRLIPIPASFPFCFS
jgi:hypothetical protein